jgi:N-acyl-D-amino-acid deacylase
VSQRSLSRRTALQVGAAGTAFLATASLAEAAQSATPEATPVAVVPMTGQEVPELAALEAVLQSIMTDWSLPGAQLAIAREGRLVYNRGFGYADVEAGTVVEPDNIFRIASTSKPITTVAILTLVDAGDLTLDTQVFPLLDFESAPNAPIDPRLASITVEQLLVHAGGWDSTVSGDPQYMPWTNMASSMFGLEDPAEAETIIRFMLGVPLDFDPGTRSVYSNFGFNVLGRVIEHVSGQSYGDYVQEQVLEPAGVTDMVLGKTRLDERADGEVRYYDPPGRPLGPSVFPGEGYGPSAYGGFYLESLDAHGGWVGSAEDLVKFTLAIDGTRGPALLSPETVTAMETTQRPPSGEVGAGNEPGGLGLGWNSQADDDGFEWTHAGALEGSNASWLIRFGDGMVLAFVANSLPIDFGSFFGALIPTLRQAVAETTTWPADDQFE